MKKKRQNHAVTLPLRGAALRAPSVRDFVHHRVNVQGQRKFLAAQDAQQAMIERMRLGTLRGNPYIQ